MTSNCKVINGHIGGDPILCICDVSCITITFTMVTFKVYLVLCIYKVHIKQHFPSHQMKPLCMIGKSLS